MEEGSRRTYPSSIGAEAVAWRSEVVAHAARKRMSALPNAKSLVLTTRV